MAVLSRLDQLSVGKFQNVSSRYNFDQSSLVVRSKNVHKTKSFYVLGRGQVHRIPHNQMDSQLREGFSRVLNDVSKITCKLT